MTDRVRPRIAVAGVRRVRQGLGQFFAQWLVAAGAEVPAFLGRTAETIDEARRMLAARGIAAQGFTSLDALLRTVPVDALVIASPAETHAELLEAALAARLHVLCEKPLVAGRSDAAEFAMRMEREFAAAGLVLAENCQWPETLPFFATIHRGTLDEAPRRFQMELAPSTTGAAMLLDTMSHVVSMLQALSPPNEGAGAARIEGLRFSTDDPGATSIDVEFGFVRDDDFAPTPSGAHMDGDEGSETSDGADIEVAVRLRPGPSQPRPAAYAVNGRRVDRRVRMPEYGLVFEGGGRSVHVPDPMGL
ncbi:MAG: Gfo/Idh/MocA family oxidoreductase, partial [Planctomycetes bacterium]|nr:Gfo/Idh/MocA family oxidoreductase [Planctomycetota bacterium]